MMEDREAPEEVTQGEEGSGASPRGWRVERKSEKHVGSGGQEAKSSAGTRPRVHSSLHSVVSPARFIQTTANRE